jgi:hypothetical protein
MYRKFDVTENLFFHSVFLTEHSIASLQRKAEKQVQWAFFSSPNFLRNDNVVFSLLFGN